MNVDALPPPPSPPAKFNLQPTNTLAGPSTLPDQSQLPPLFLPPTPPPEYPRPRAYFTSTEDLLGRFQLLPAYDRYVRPFITTTPSASTSTSTQLGGAQVPVTAGAIGKGKGREIPGREGSIASSVVPTPAAGAAAGNEGEDEDGHGKGEKKWKNYKHLIKGIPGKHSMKKDDYLVTMMQVPPKQRNTITPFDLRTQREAFSVSLDGLKGWNINALVAASPQAREDRKRRKELKKLAKSQPPGILIPTAGATPSGPPATPVTMTVSTPGASGHPPPRTSTPKPSGLSSTSRPPPTTQLFQNAATTQSLRVRTPVGTPRSVSTPGVPSSTLPPVMASSVSAPANVNQVSTPAPTPSASSDGGVKRGMKREREDSTGTGGSGGGGGGGMTNGNGHAPTSVAGANGNGKVAVGVRAGMNGIRPRPVKKQRMDTQGQGREMPVQQPTPRA